MTLDTTEPDFDLTFSYGTEGNGRERGRGREAGVEKEGEGGEGKQTGWTLLERRDGQRSGIRRRGMWKVISCVTSGIFAPKSSGKLIVIGYMTSICAL